MKKSFYTFIAAAMLFSSIAAPATVYADATEIASDDMFTEDVLEDDTLSDDDFSEEVSDEDLFEEETMETEENIIETETETVDTLEAAESEKEDDPENINPQITAFITRLYQNVLSRKPDSQGLTFWYNQLANENYSAGKAAYGFIFSKEYTNKDVDDTTFITMLYNALMNRNPDTSGFNYWSDKLKTGTTRENVFYGFVNSPEFNKLCNTYGLTCEPMIAPDTGSAEIPTGTAGFVYRLYTVALNRRPEKEGADHWNNVLTSRKATPINVAKSFILSQEFINHNYDDDTFVKILYLTFFDRSPESSGKTYWLNRLAAGESRESILEEFAQSQEFKNICRSYGLSRDVSRYIFIGDSRTVQMEMAVPYDSKDYWYSRGSMGYSWFTGTAWPSAQYSVTEDSVVLVLMGINDIGTGCYNPHGVARDKATQYANKLKEIDQYVTSQGAKLYFVSVNPIQESTYTSDSLVLTFNDQMVKELAGTDIGFIDTYSYIRPIVQFADWAHYKNATSNDLYNFIKKAVDADR